MPGRRRRPSERAIIYAGILGNLSREKINELLEDISPKANKLIVPSYKWLCRQYRAAMAPTLLDPDTENLLGTQIYRPLPVGEFPGWQKKTKAVKKRKPLKKKSR